MAIDYASFKTQFPDPQFPVSSAPQTEVELALTEAETLHGLRELATLYCAAHLLTLNNDRVDELNRWIGRPDGGSGVVGSEKIGPRTITYLNQVADAD